MNPQELGPGGGRTLDDEYRLLARDPESEREANGWTDSLLADWFSFDDEENGSGGETFASLLDGGESHRQNPN